MRKRDKKKEQKELVENYSFVLQFGLNMMVPILGCTAVGIYIDNLVGCSVAPMIGFLVGALSGYTSIYKMVKKRFKKGTEDEKHN